MKPYKFSPIENIDQLLEAIKYTHYKCSDLCKNILGRYLPVAGNVGIFCHYDDEYKFLTKLREELTEISDNWNQKYYRLHKPIVVPAQGDVPDALYSYLYIRQPDQEKTQVGDVDFVLDKKEFNELKSFLSSSQEIKGMKIFDRPGLDLIELFDSDIDTISFIGMKDMFENVKINPILDVKS